MRSSRNQNPLYKESSSESEDDYVEADSTFDKTLEDNTIDGAKKELKNRGLKQEIESTSELLKNCKLDGSIITYEESEEEVEEGFIVGGPNKLGIVDEGAIMVLENENQPNAVRMC